MKNFKVLILSFVLTLSLISGPKSYAGFYADNEDVINGIGLFALVAAAIYGISQFNSSDKKDSSSSKSSGNSSKGKAPTSEDGKINLMMIGDSITQASGGTGDVRCALWKKLQELGTEFDFVGSVKGWSGGGGSGDCDNDHEAHWGWKTDAVLKSMQSSVPSNKPGMAVIHMGTNDIRGGQGNSSTVNEIEQMIDLVVANNPEAVIFVAGIIPNDKDNTHSQTADLNTKISQMAETKSTDANPVIFVDQNAGFSESDFADKIHPNASGADKMASKWFEAIKSYLGK